MRRARPTIPVTAKLDVNLAEEFFDVVDREYSGCISLALRDAIKRLIEEKSKETIVHKPAARM